MLIKQCSNSGICKATYNENDMEFKLGLCRCGNILIDMEIEIKDCSDFVVEEVLGFSPGSLQKTTMDESDKVSESNTNNPTIDIKSLENSNSDISIDTNSNEITEVAPKKLMKKPVVTMTLEEFKKANSVEYTVDSRGYIHFTNASNIEELDEDKLVIYLGPQVYKEVPIEYDETIIGRYSVTSEPDVDLSEIDTEGYTSRRHLMIYRENNKYFARNLSTKNSVHINAKPLIQGQDKELNDNDIIILSRYIVMNFKLKK